MHQVEHIACAPTEPIELDHDQFVASADELHDAGQLIPALSGFSADLLLPDD